MPGKGLFISADAQPKAQGQVLDMSAALDRLQQAGDQLQKLSVDAQASQAEPADVQAQLTLMRDQLKELNERDNIADQVKNQSLDPEISRSTRYVQWLAPSHHQKSVLVDYELPDRAVGFVMGHNMLDEYWDTDSHSALNRSEDNKLAPNCGPRGDHPRQDISSQVTGPILEHLHHNFATAWLKETGEDLLVSRQAMHVGQQLQCTGGTPQLAQLLRTQPQAGKRDIEQLYLKAVNNATQFIYIENQYFRWPPLAETIPEVTKLRRIKQVKEDAPPQPRPEPRDRPGQREQAQWQAELDQQIQQIKDSTIVPHKDIPGLKVQVCSLVAPDSPAGKPWMPVYIHSKLMIVNDVFTTLGSANINTRSMQVDSELNIAHEWMSVTQALRRRLWDLHTAGKGGRMIRTRRSRLGKRSSIGTKNARKIRKMGCPTGVSEILCSGIT